MGKRVGSVLLVLVVIAATVGVVSVLAAPSGQFGTGWTAQYFNNAELSGSPVFTEALPGGIQFNWGTGSPNSTVPVDNFSVRFTSVQNLVGGIYSFGVTSDDGVRVYIDNVLVLDRWGGRVATTDIFEQSLTAGPHTFQVDYQELVDNALVQFQFNLVSPQGVIPPTQIQGGGGFVPTPFGTPEATWFPTRVPPTALPQIPPGALTGTVIRAQVLLARNAPYFAGGVVGRLQRGQTYQVIGRDDDARWFLLQLSGFQGWVWGHYLFVNGNEFNAPVIDAFTAAGIANTGVIAQTNAVLRLRAAPTTDSPQTGRIPWGDLLPITGRTGNNLWYQVVFRGTTGWVAAEFVTILEGDVNSLPAH